MDVSIWGGNDIDYISIHNLIGDRANVTVLSRGARASLNRLATMVIHSFRNGISYLSIYSSSIFREIDWLYSSPFPWKRNPPTISRFEKKRKKKKGGEEEKKSGSIISHLSERSVSRSRVVVALPCRFFVIFYFSPTDRPIVNFPPSLSLSRVIPGVPFRGTT